MGWPGLPPAALPHESVHVVWQSQCTSHTSSTNKALLSLQTFEKTAFRKIMPPWSPEELELARPYASVPVSRDTVEGRYMAWGGNVRYCLSPAAEFGKDRLAAALGVVHADSFSRLLGRVDLTPVCQILSLSKKDCNMSKQTRATCKNAHLRTLSLCVLLQSCSICALLICWSIFHGHAF